MNIEHLGFTKVDDNKRKELLEDKTWITNEGKELPIADMGHLHLINAYNVIGNIKDNYFKKWKRILMKEIRSRKNKWK